MSGNIHLTCKISKLITITNSFTESETNPHTTANKPLHKGNKTSSKTVIIDFCVYSLKGIMFPKTNTPKEYPTATHHDMMGRCLLLLLGPRPLFRQRRSLQGTRPGTPGDVICQVLRLDSGDSLMTGRETRERIHMSWIKVVCI